MKASILLSADEGSNVVRIKGTFEMEYQSKSPAFDATAVVEAIERAVAAAGGSIEMEATEPVPSVRESEGYKAAKARKPESQKARKPRKKAAS